MVYIAAGDRVWRNAVPAAELLHQPTTCCDPCVAQGQHGTNVFRNCSRYNQCNTERNYGAAVPVPSFSAAVGAARNAPVSAGVTVSAKVRKEQRVQHQ